jgi:hypothetical protein
MTQSLQRVSSNCGQGEGILKRIVSFAALTSVCVSLALTAASGSSAATNDGGLLGGLLGSNCPTSGTKVFSRWNDYNAYYLGPNGGFENGSTGWSLSGGASVGYGNQPFFSSGSHSLALPSGSKATSPVICLGPKNVALRMFGADRGGTDSGLHVRVLWYGLLNILLGSSDYNTFAPGNDWAPTDSVNSTGGLNVLLPIVGSTSARVQITPLGSGSAWRIDDFYIDPWASACC